MSQVQGERKDTAFDGRIQLAGDAAPELEVVVELDDRNVILVHSSGELGRWDKGSVHVSPIGRGWFALDVEDETVTFSPRRPGHFAAATVEMVPQVEEPKRRFRRKTREGKAEAPSRKERKRLRREEAAAASVEVPPPAPTPDAPVSDPAETAVAPEPVAEPAAVEPVAEPVAPVSEPVEPEVPVSEPGAVEPAVEPEMPDDQVGRAAVWVEPTPAPEPQTLPPSGPPAVEPASPWDDVPVPEVPGPKPKKRSRRTSGAPPLRTETKSAKAPREKAPKPSRDKPVEPAGPPKKSSLNRGLTGFRHGLKGVALRVSDELRQTGIVPFDRLPAASGRKRVKDDHDHVFEEHRLPGGLMRNVCYECGRVSIGESAGDD